MTLQGDSLSDPGSKMNLSGVHCSCPSASAQSPALILQAGLEVKATDSRNKIPELFHCRLEMAFPLCRSAQKSCEEATT